MPDKKLTDKEIVKALECCTNEGYPLGCEKCLYNDFNCNENLDVDALDLINRQDEEINRLQAENEDYKALYEGLKAEHIETIKAIKRYKAEAYKEFADTLHTEICQALDSNYKAREERLSKYNIGDMAEFISYLDGKIFALRGIDFFIEKTCEKMVGEKPEREGEENAT